MNFHNISKYMLYSCLLLILAIAILFKFNVIDTDGFAVGSSVLAILAAIFGYLAIEPPEFPGTPEQYMSIMDERMHKKLHTSEKEKEDIDAFIAKSNILVLTKLRDSLQTIIMERYEKSELKDLMVYLDNIEDQLQSLGVSAEDLKVPARLRKLVKDINKSKDTNIYFEIIDTIPYFGPFRGISKLYLKYLLSLRDQLQLRLQSNERNSLITEAHTIIEKQAVVSENSAEDIKNVINKGNDTINMNTKTISGNNTTNENDINQ